MKRKWLMVLAPAGLGLVMAGVLMVMPVTNPIIYLRADLGTLVVLVGLILSGLLAGRGLR